ncbi:rhomboid family intramembrane serine protease [Amycolatopsis sp. H20-H5]|uniref:rhomboid family intramembrane serine protease n=1 Tax=Amycolatopsis sp. H20-H5 TaxID=3046309 RepID=UPI002DBA5C38|nr:rhomboid family intramembrane serine protease [Amycolatopsis sp. H20-H5]MEC3974556.1 rhomboid family intramembrane serine protease [Amycolatopsis sp. H20-H5]
MNQPPNPAWPQQAAQPGCWWHPNRQTGLSCARCERPACPDCLREAAVGFQCTDCIQGARRQDRAQQKQYQAAGLGQRTIAGVRPPKSVLVTPILFAVNVLVFLVTVVQAKSPMDNNVSSLFQWGELWLPATLEGNEWWRVFTSGFLHYGLIHIAANMFSLWMVGRPLELVFGRARFVTLYFVAMLGGSAANLLFDNLDSAPSVGASGALLGLIGAYGVIVIKERLNPTWLIINLVLNVYVTFQVPGISIFAHLGGFVLGGLATVALLYAPEKDKLRWQVVGIAVLVVAVIGLLVWRDAQFGQAACAFGSQQGQQVYGCTPTG